MTLREEILKNSGKDLFDEEVLKKTPDSRAPLTQNEKEAKMSKSELIKELKEIAFEISLIGKGYNNEGLRESARRLGQIINAIQNEL